MQDSIRQRSTTSTPTRAQRASVTRSRRAHSSLRWARTRLQAIPTSGTKGATGHCLGAAGAVEAAFTVLAVDRDIVPPTINYQTPDPACDVDCVPNEAREQPVRVALSNSFGFGGHNAVLILRKLLDGPAQTT